MKTSEMIAMLEKNANYRYQFIWSDGIIWEAFNDNGSIRCIFGKGSAYEDATY